MKGLAAMRYELYTVRYRKRENQKSSGHWFVVVSEPKEWFPNLASQRFSRSTNASLQIVPSLYSTADDPSSDHSSVSTGV